MLSSFSSDSKLIISASDDKHVIYMIHAAVKSSPLAGHSSWVLSVSISPMANILRQDLLTIKEVWDLGTTARAYAQRPCGPSLVSQLQFKQYQNSFRR